MADSYDGSIRIKTAIDNSEFKAGSNELLAAIKNLTQAVERNGNIITTWSKKLLTALKALDQSMEKSGEVAEKSSEAIGESASSVDAVKDSADGAADSISRIGEATGRAKTEAEEVEECYQRNLAKLDEWFNSLGNEPEPVEIEVDEEPLEELAETVEEVKEQASEPVEIPVQEPDVSSVRDAVEEVREAAAEPVEISVDNPADQIKELEKEYRTLVTAMNKLSRVRVDSLNPEQLQAYKTALSETKKRISELQARMEKVGSTNFRTDEYRDFDEQVTQARDRLAELLNQQDRMDARKVDQSSYSYIRLKEKIADTRKEIDELEASKATLDNLGEGTIKGSSVSGFQKLVGNIQRLKTEADGLPTSFRKIGFALNGNMVPGLKKVSSTASKAFSNLKKMVGKAITGGIDRLKSALSGLSSSGSGGGGGNLAGVLKKSLRTIMRYGIGVRSLYYLVNKLKTAIGEGFGLLAAEDKRFNAAMSAWYSSLQRLRNALSSAFAPIITAAMPALTALIDRITVATDKVAQFIAALTGQKTYMKASAVQVDYAKDIAKTTKETDKNTKALKENQKVLAGFDDVEILKDNSNDDELDDLNTDSLFEEVPVEAQVGDFLQRLKDAWNKADFTELGRILGEKLRNALEQIPWDQIKAVLRKIAKSIATFLNGFLETPGLFSTIGHTLAEALNSAFEFLESFITNFHWASLGRAVKDGVLGFLNGIDWPLIYRTATGLGAGIGLALTAALNNPELWTALALAGANGLNAMVQGMKSFIESVPWGSIAANIATGLNAGISAIDWQALGNLLALGINSAFDFMNRFITTFDWGLLGKNLAWYLNSAFYGIDWSLIGTTLANGLNAVFQYMNSFIVNFDWYGLANDITTFLNSMVAGIDWIGIGTALGNGITAAFMLWYGFVRDFDWNLFGDSVGSSLSAVLNSIDWETGGYAVGQTITGLFQALNSFIEATEWNKLSEGICTFIASALGSFDWSQLSRFFSDCFIAMCKFATGVLEGLKEIDDIPGAIVNAIKSFLTGFKWKDLFTEVGKVIGTAIQTVFKIGGDFWNDVKKVFASLPSAGFKGIIDGLGDIARWLQDNVCDPFLNGLMSALGIPNNNSNSKETEKIGQDTAGGMKDGLDSGFDIKNGESKEMSTRAGHVGSGFTNGLKESTKNIGQTAQTLFVNPFLNGITNGFDMNSPSKVMETHGQNVGIGFDNGWTRAFQSTINQVASYAVRFINNFTSCFNSNNFRTIGQNIMSAFTNGLNYGWQWISNFLYNTAQAMINYFQNINWSNIGRYIVSGIANGLWSGVQYLWDSVSNICSGLMNSACRILGIASPSKVFRDMVGKNIVAGIAVGLEKNENLAVNGIKHLAEKIEQEGENLSPEIDAEIAGIHLSDDLENISDSFLSRFGEWINALDNIVSSAVFSPPDVAAGYVSPYKSRMQTNTAGNSQENRIDGITKSDLQALGSQVVKALEALNVIIGDETIAMAANRGNQKLRRRGVGGMEYE